MGLPHWERLVSIEGRGRGSRHRDSGRGRVALSLYPAPAACQGCPPEVCPTAAPRQDCPSNVCKQFIVEADSGNLISATGLTGAIALEDRSVFSCQEDL